MDLIAKLVQVLRDAPELGAIEVRRGPFGLWSSVRVSRAGCGLRSDAAVPGRIPLTDRMDRLSHER